MGAKLADFFGEAEKLGGTVAKVKLAMLTKLSGKTALAAADSPENIKMMEVALAAVKKELGK